MSKVATIENGAGKASLIATMAAGYHMEPVAFAATVKATCGLSQATNEEFAAFLMVAHKYGLSPITREIYAFPKKGGGIQPIVGIDGWINLINSHPAADGVEFEDDLTGEGGKLAAITCKIYRKDRSHPTMVTEYMAECARPTEPWQKWPSRMLRHKALIQCARYAFGFAGIIDPDEAERSPVVITPPPARIMAPPPPKEPEALNVTNYLSDLEGALAVALDAETVEEIMTELGVEEVLADKTSALFAASNLMEKRLAQLAAAKKSAKAKPVEPNFDRHEASDFPGDRP